MQPQQPQPPQSPYPSNYLDSIAPAPQVKTMNPMVLWGFIVGVLILAVVVVLGLASAAGGNTDNLKTFGYQMAELKTLTQESQEYIQSSQLRTLNSSLTLVLTNTNRDLAGPLASEDIDLENKDAPEAKLASQQIGEIKQRLEDARLNAIYDRTYAREFSFILKAVSTEIGVMYEKTSNEKLQTVLSDTHKSLDSLQKDFSNFNES